jgi:CzcA family heavy metal efflux pump
MCFFILLMGILSIKSMIVDIFPTIDIPVVSVIWQYTGLSPEEMERRVVYLSERAISTTVGGVSKIESSSIQGIGILRVYFQQGADIASAIAQISAVSSGVLRAMPPGMTPPAILQFNASNVPVAQLMMSSETMPEEKIFDYGVNFIRVKLFTIPGLATPAPYGGKGRQITVDVNPKKLTAKGLSPADVVTALAASNVILPAGTARIGTKEYNIAMNASPASVDLFNQIPVKVVDGAPVLLGDVADVYDGYAVQNNIVHVNGKRATYLAIIKKADASTLAVVDAAKEALPAIKAAAPNGLDLNIDFDQSTFVKGAVGSVVQEAIIASILVSLMILIFLGSWRSVILVCTSIPLAIFVGIIGLKLTGNTINIMTLGGLSLAIGMLVDDATVEVENIHRNRLLGKPLTVAILDGAKQIAVPAIMATLSICIVFFPVVLLTGPSKFLFTPMALAVVISMLASYLLSRTLVPTLARMLMHGEHHPTDNPKKGFSVRFNEKRDAIFDRFRDAYGRVLHSLLEHRTITLTAAGLVFAATCFLPMIIGTDFFPTTDAGLMKLHFRAPSGTRLEETEKIVLGIEDRIRRIIPLSELQTINDQVGVPTSYNLSFVSSDNVNGMDAEILVSLKPEHHPTVGYMKRIRQELSDDYPGSSIYFQPADITSQVLNFGLSSPIDVQIEYGDFQKSYPYARKLRDELKTIPGAVDVNIKQSLDYPTLRVDVDRIRAAQAGVSERDIASSMLISLSSSSLLSPSFYLNPVNNVNYNVVVKVPIEQITTLDELMSTPVTPPSAGALLQQTSAQTPIDIPRAPAQTLGNLATVKTIAQPNQINHYTLQRVLNVTANVEDRDLGSVTNEIEKKIANLGELPPGMKITLRGQNEVMKSSFSTFGLGIILAIILVYLLMAIQFQSWLDPFIIMIAIPGALIGILWMLAVSGTTINVVSLMGSIMAVGIAVSNSILLVNFANDVRIEHNFDSRQAALEAGKTRLRPVLMTALAMILGMIPMALGLGEGGEQNAPLGRAVIGGLIIATVMTLFVVPVVYSLLRKKLPTKHRLDEKFEAEERGIEDGIDLTHEVVTD